MNQSRLGSLIEALINVAIGFAINFVANILILPLIGFHVMDYLINQDRHGIADRAGRWSLEQMRSLRSTGKSALISL